MKKAKVKKPINEETVLILKDCWWGLFIKFIVSVLYRGILLLTPIFWGKAIDMLTINKMDDCYRYVIITLVVTLAYYAIACYNQVVYNKLYGRMYKNFSKTIYKSVVNNSLYSLSRFELGEFSNIVNTDIDIVVMFLCDLVLKVVRLLEFIIIFYYFFTINKVLFVLTLFFSILCFLVFIVTGDRVKKYNDTRKKYLDKKFAITHEVFHTIKEIKGFFVFKSVNERIKDICSKYLSATEKYDVFSTYVKQGVLALIEITRYLAAIYGMYLCSKGKIEVGTILVIYSYYAKLTENFENIGVLMIGLEDFRVSMARLNKLLEFETINTSNSSISNKEYEGNIEFRDVLYGNKLDPILNNVSLEIKSNSITVITGETGSGKTGVFDLLMRFNRQHSGEVLIDGEKYQKIRDEDYYNLVSLVGKDPTFFDLSIKDNLMLVTESFTRVKRVCSDIGIHDDIMELKNNYDTKLTDSTEKVSKNLKLGIAVARTILKDSKIMMFDETIEMLDDKYKKNVIKVLNDLKKDHTIIIISRNEDVIKLGDKIIEFDNNVVKKTRKSRKSKGA